MHIFVINLPENSARREAMGRQLQSLNLAYEILPAVRGKSLTAEERRRNYDEDRCIRTVGHSLSAGVLGCSLSHIAFYRKVVESDISHALVLEDDAWLNPNLPQLLDAIEKQFSADQTTTILLSWTNAVTNPYRRLWAGYGLRPVRSAVCTHAYVVTHAAAKALLKALYPVHNVADCWDWLIKHGIAEIQAVIPPCITTDLAYDSDITPEMQKMIGAWSLRYRLLRKIKRAWWKSVDEVAAVGHRFRNGRGRK